ncbi:hypothetical protein ABWH96_05195 [Marivirga tractuosa]|uniref:DUF6892 domain-containing protein n=1 Tax=Marivirga tractuosa TaxID=1006 RepID=UPI0035D077BA
MNNFLATKDITLPSYQSIVFTVSTCEIDNWLYSRNKLKAEDVCLTLRVSADDSWLVQLDRHDGLYCVQWRPNNNLQVESQQLKYRRLIPWPPVESPEDFPQLIRKIEQSLGIKFIKHANVSLFESMEQHLSTESKLVKWLKTGTETVGTNMTSKPKAESDHISQDSVDDRVCTVPNDKYQIPEIKEELIEFKDFNFKLSVIQELMYFQEVLKPKFDLYEFVDWYQERRIDIEKEGYDFIPEVTRYFQELPIPKSLAKYVTNLSQDGSDDIYFSMLRFHDGEGDEFDIESAEDAKHFPNLKKVSLCYAKKSVFKEFQILGIKAALT